MDLSVVGTEVIAGVFVSGTTGAAVTGAAALLGALVQKSLQLLTLVQFSPRPEWGPLLMRCHNQPSNRAIIVLD